MCPPTSVAKTRGKTPNPNVAAPGSDLLDDRVNSEWANPNMTADPENTYYDEPGRTGKKKSGNDVVDSAVLTVNDSAAYLRDAEGKLLKDEDDKKKLVAKGTKVKILEEKTIDEKLRVRIADVDGNEIGWTNYSNLTVTFVDDSFFRSQMTGGTQESDYVGDKNCRLVSADMLMLYMKSEQSDKLTKLGLSTAAEDWVSQLNTKADDGDPYLRVLSEDKSKKSETTEKKNFKNEAWLNVHKQNTIAIEYIETHLKDSVPVLVGVDHTYNRKLSGDKTSSKEGDGYNEGTTDHFILLTGMGKNSDGQRFFNFYDPARRHVKQGTQAKNQLVETSKGKFVAGGVGGFNAQTYHLSMVVLFPADRDEYDASRTQNTKDRKALDIK